MPVYVFRSPAGKVIERHYPMGEAPQKIGRYERHYGAEVQSSVVQYIGGNEAGWTRAKPEHRVTWGDVEKHMKHCEVTRKENQKKQLKQLTTFIADHL